MAKPRLRRITLEDILPRLRKAVADRGAEYRYTEERCVYWDHELERPGCLVGWVLDDLGVDLGRFTPRENETSINSLTTGNPLATDVLSRQGVTFDQDATELLVYAQVMQDTQIPWGAIVDRVTAWTGEDDAPDGFPYRSDPDFV